MRGLVVTVAAFKDAYNTGLKGTTIMNNGRKDVVVPYFNALSQHLHKAPRRTTNLESRQQVAGRDSNSGPPENDARMLTHIATFQMTKLWTTQHTGRCNVMAFPEFVVQFTSDRSYRSGNKLEKWGEVSVFANRRSAPMPIRANRTAATQVGECFGSLKLNLLQNF